MNRFIAFSVFLLISTYVLAQKKASIRGILVDSLTTQPLEFATIALVNANDTSLISYTLSDKKGEFKLAGLPSEKNIKLIISYVGYKTIRQNLNLKQEEVKDFGMLTFSGNNLNEVIIMGERSPVTVKKDTIEFNTEAFKTRPNAVVEELLRKLPGVQVNTDGSILVNGKQISKLLIDGKEFFGTDPKIATKNLDADLIDKIQVYDDRENDPDHKVSAAKVNKIINLKLKSKIKKSLIGKVYGGAGTRDRYETGGLFNSFRDTLQVSLIGIANNLNKTGFNSQDLYSMGGFDRSGSDEMYNGTLGGQSWGGLQNLMSTGFNINTDYGKKLKLNLVYFYTRKEDINSGKSNQEQYLNDKTLMSNSMFNSKRISANHSISGLIAWTPDTLNNIRYTPKFNTNKSNNSSFSNKNSFSNLEPKISESNGSNLQDVSGNSFSHDFSYFRRLKKKGESLNIKHSLRLMNNRSDSYSRNDLVSYSSTLQSQLIDRYANGYNNGNSADAGITYVYPITKKLSADLNSVLSYVTATENLFTYDRNTAGKHETFLPTLSNELDRNTFSQNIQPLLKYEFNDKYSVRIGVNAAFQSIKNKFHGEGGNINQHFSNLFPVVNFEANGFSVNYGERLELPQLALMQPIIREYSQLYKFIGNPDLKPTHSREVAGYYYKYYNDKQINFNLYSNLTFLENNIINKNLIDNNGANTVTTVNRNNGFRGNFGAGLSKQFKKSQDWQIGINTSINSSMVRNAFFLNEDEGLQLMYGGGIVQSVDFNYNELLTINANYKFNASITEYKKVDYISVKTFGHMIGSEFSLRWPKRIIIDGNYSFNYNPQITEGFQKSSNIINLAISILMLKKDRGQLKLSVYDLFDENVSVNRYAASNSVNISEQQVLKRYFLLTYQYKFNIYKSK